MVDCDIQSVAHREDPPSATERVAKLRLVLNHLTLAELEKQGVVEWVKNEQVVTEGPLFDEKEREVMDDE